MATLEESLGTGVTSSSLQTEGSVGLLGSGGSVWILLVLGVTARDAVGGEGQTPGSFPCASLLPFVVLIQGLLSIP